jgi:hypothetical protein
MEHTENRPPARRQVARGASVWVGAIGVLGATAMGVLLTLNRPHSGRRAVPTTPPPVVNTAALPGLETGPPPWPAERGNLRARLRVLGLPALSRAGTALHTHQHLDVFMDGRHVTVPAGIGIAEHFVSRIHTHDTSGLIHVESPTSRSFSLAEFFGVWGLRLTKNCLGSTCDGAQAAPLRERQTGSGSEPGPLGAAWRDRGRVRSPAEAASGELLVSGRHLTTPRINGRPPRRRARTRACPCGSARGQTARSARASCRSRPARQGWCRRSERP